MEKNIPKLTRNLLQGGFAPPPELTVGARSVGPERIIQFGEGNFLRAFVDWMVQALNARGLFAGSVVIIQPLRQGRVRDLNAQQGLYTVLLRGADDGRTATRAHLITAVSRGIDPYPSWRAFLACAANPDLRFLVSNTTEAGIAYREELQPIDQCPESFPAKVTVFLYERFLRFRGAAEKGMVFLPCELIDRNGERLKECILKHADAWGLERTFVNWLEEHNAFLTTLVDRIIPGVPEEEASELMQKLGYRDELLVAGELYHLWVIEGDERYAEELPFREAGLNVIWTDALSPYRTRKVRILNGAHTLLTLAAFLCGLDTVGESVTDPMLRSFLQKALFQEIIPSLDASVVDPVAYARTVLERFANPALYHRLLSIALNAVSKFRVRVLPSLLEYRKRNGELPPALTFSLAALIAFYRGTEVEGGSLQGARDGSPYAISDDPEVLRFFADRWNMFARTGDSEKLCERVLSRAALWGRDLRTVPGLAEAVKEHMAAMLANGVRASLAALVR